MDAALLVDGVEGRGLGALVREQGGDGVELQALRDKVLELDLGEVSVHEDRKNVATHLSAENVAGGPRLREGEAVGLVCVLALKLAVDRARGCKRMIVSLMHRTREGRAK